MAHTYVIYVADANGWDEGCPDSEGVFFGSIPDGANYIHMADGGHEIAGQVEIAGCSAAKAYLRHLNNNGDWVAPEEINEDGEETRPTYAMRRATCPHCAKPLTPAEDFLRAQGVHLDAQRSY